jgi:hypothetical protein
VHGTAPDTTGEDKRLRKCVTGLSPDKMNLFELLKQKCGWTDQEVQNNVRVI